MSFSAFSTPRPRLPPVPIIDTVNVLNCAAVIDSVDDPLNPGVVSVIIGDALPAQSGFVWNASFAQTFKEAPATVVNTVLTNTTVAGPAIKFIPASMVSITEGQSLVVGNETIIVVTITATYFTGHAKGGHSVGTSITLSGPPNGTIWYNNHISHTGGTIVYVDIQSRTVISVTHNISSLVAQDYSLLFQYIKHTGAYNTTHSFQQPYPIDNSQLATNPDPTTPPAFLIFPHNTSGNPLDEPFDYIIGSTNTTNVTNFPSATYDAETNFTLTIGTELWLAAIRMFVIPAGYTFDYSAENGDIVPDLGGDYTVIFNGCGAGKQYDCYIAFVDMASNIGAPLLVGTTSVNAMLFAGENMIALNPTTAPYVANITLNPVIINQPGISATWDQPITWTGDLNQTFENKTVAEIQLMAAKTLTNVWMKVGSFPPLPKGWFLTNQTEQIWPTLGAANTYDLGIRLEGWNGQVGQIAYLATSNENGQIFTNRMPYGAQQAGPNIISDSILGTQLVGSAAVNVQLQCEIGPGPVVGDGWLANEQPIWFAGCRFYWRIHDPSNTTPTPPWSGILCGISGPQGSIGGVSPGSYINFYTNALSIPAAVNLDFGLSYLDLALDESYITWPPGAWRNIDTIPPPPPPVPVTPYPPGMKNFVSDSWFATTQSAGIGTSPQYWTWAWTDANWNLWSEDGTSWGPRASKNGPVAVYSVPISVYSGLKYTVGCLGHHGSSGTGTCKFGLVNVSDKNADSGTPLSIYQSMETSYSYPSAAGTFFNWTATFTGEVVYAMWGYNLGVGHYQTWSHPSFMPGWNMDSYVEGLAALSEQAYY